MPSPFDAPVAPPSFVPQINSLGSMIDHFAQRRMELQQQQDQAAAAEENKKRLLAKDAEREAYGRRKEDIAEKKVDADSASKRAQATQGSLKEAKSAIARGQHPGTMLVQGPDGNPAYVDWKFVPGQQGVAQSSSTPPPPGPPPVPPPPVATATTDGQAQVDPKLEALMSRAAAPANDPPSSGDNSIFLDRNDEGTATALSVPEGQNRQELPIKAFPEGATEGQSFAPEDVNLKGGFGNPFASPLPPSDNPEFGNGMLPNAESGSVFTPPRDIRGMSMQTGQPQGGRWEALLPDGQVITVDPNEARAAKRDQDAQDLREIDVALADPATRMNPQVFQYLAIKKQSLLGDMSPAEIKQVYAQAGTMERQGAQIASNEKIAGEKIAGQKDVEQLKQEGRIALQAAKKHGRSGGGSGLGGIKVQPDGQVEDIPIPQTRFGPRPDMLLQRVEQAWRSNSLDEKLPVQLLGLRRLKLAEHNIAANGPDSGILNMEAAFNYLGFVRGGVPVQNETKEMLDHRRTWADSIHGILARAGLGEMAAKFSKGDELTKDEVNQAISVMSPAEKARITEGIHESLSVMTGQVGDTLTSFSSQFANLGGKGGHLIRQYAVDVTNQRLKANGLPSDFNPFNDTRVAGDSPFMKRSPGSPNPAGSSAPATAGAPSGKLTDQQLLDALKGMK